MLHSFTTIILALAMSFSATNNASDDELFVVVTSADAETQMMAMVLATQTLNRERPVRVLLCSDAGYLATPDHESETFEPAGRSPKELLGGLMERGVTVEVCGIFLPNRELEEGDLTEGVGVAAPPEVAEYMSRSNVRYFTF